VAPKLAQLLEEARSLPQDERAELASAIWETVEEDWQVELSPEWQAEIAERISAIDAGEVELLSEEEVNDRLREKYGPLFD
jgi:putative addiction module component (TIGR02574 family)